MRLIDGGLVAVKKKLKVSIRPDESVRELKKAAADFKVKRAAAAYWGEGEQVPFMFRDVKLHIIPLLRFYDVIIPALVSGGVWDLPVRCSSSLGIPVGPMLAESTKGVSEIVEKFQGMAFTCEYKYHGERAQIHYMENG